METNDACGCSSDIIRRNHISKRISMLESCYEQWQISGGDTRGRMLIKKEQQASPDDSCLHTSAGWHRHNTTVTHGYLFLFIATLQIHPGRRASRSPPRRFYSRAPLGFYETNEATVNDNFYDIQRTATRRYRAVTSARVSSILKTGSRSWDAVGSWTWDFSVKRGQRSRGNR